MNNTKLISLLRSYSKDEFEEFGNFVASPYFNKRQPVIALFNLIKDSHPAFDEKEINKEKIFGKLYRGEYYNDELMRNLISHLYTLAEKFMQQKGFEKDFIAGKKYLMRELTDRNLFKLFEKNLQKTKVFFEKDRNLTSTHFMNRYFIELEIIHYLNFSKSTPFLVNDNAQKIADNLLNFFLIASMGIYSYMINQSKNAFDYDFKMSFLEKILEHVESSDFEHIPSVLMQFNSIKLLLGGGDKYFYALKDILYKHRNEFSSIDIGNIYVFLNNYCYRQFTAGNKKFGEISLELYKDMFSNNAHRSQGYLHHILYKNAVTCALSIREFKWTEDFINKYKDQLLDEHRESSFNLCNAFLNFHKGNYEESLKFMSKITLEDITYKIDVKALTCMVYYDLNSQESLYSQIDSYKHFLKLNELIPQRLRESHTCFVNYLSKFIKAKENNDRVTIQNLKEEISIAPYFIHKEWLLKEI